MTRPDRMFALGTALATLVVPTLIAVATPFDEARSTFGVAVGWAAMLLVMVPSYVIVSRTFAPAVKADGRPDNNGFLAGFVGGALGRMVLTVAAVWVFWAVVADAPIKTYVLTFFLGYVVLMTLEIVLTVGGVGARRSAA